MQAHGLMKADEEGSSLLKKTRGIIVPYPATCDGKGPAGSASCAGGNINGKEGSFFWPVRKMFCNDAKNVGI